MTQLFKYLRVLFSRTTVVCM